MAYDEISEDKCNNRTTLMELDWPGHALRITIGNVVRDSLNPQGTRKRGRLLWMRYVPTRNKGLNDDGDAESTIIIIIMDYIISSSRYVFLRAFTVST